jgi:hypothetical protein
MVNKVYYNVTSWVQGVDNKDQELTSQAKCDQLGSEGTELGSYLTKLTKMRPAWSGIAKELITSPDLLQLVTKLFSYCLVLQADASASL